MKMIFAVAALAAMLVLLGCDNAPAKFSVRRISIDGDGARLAGMYFVRALQAHDVRISESAEGAPILKATSAIDRRANGVRVFTFELTDGSGLIIREVVSTQDFVLGETTACIKRAVDQAADALVRQWESKRQAPPAQQLQPKPVADPGRHFSTS